MSISGFIHHWTKTRHCRILFVHGIWWWSVEKCGQQSLKTSKIWNPQISEIGKLLPVCLTKNRRPSDHISEPRAKFGENRQRIVDIIPNRNQMRYSHISKSDFYFRFHSSLNSKSALPSFICTWNLVLICWQMWSPDLKTAVIGIRTSLKSANYFRFISQTIGFEATTFLSRMQNLVKIGKELWT